MNIQEINWGQIKKESAESIETRKPKNEWWNTKYYHNNPPNDGRKEQRTLSGKSEIPYERKIFYKHNGRFSLKDRPVAYLTNEFAINCCETIAKFKCRHNDFWEEYLKPYLDGITNPDINFYGYPSKYELRNYIGLLDLRKESNIINLLLPSFPELKHKITSTDINDYPYTQNISELLIKQGFSGILYNSVRMPDDCPFFGCNLIVFKREIIVRINENETNNKIIS